MRAFFSVLKGDNLENLLFLITKHDMDEPAKRKRLLMGSDFESEEDYCKARSSGLLEQVKGMHFMQVIILLQPHKNFKELYNEIVYYEVGQINPGPKIEGGYK